MSTGSNLRTHQPQNAGRQQAQTAIEYLLLLGTVTAVVLVGFTYFLPRSRLKSEQVFNATVNQIMGEIPMTRATATNYP